MSRWPNNLFQVLICSLPSMPLALCFRAGPTLLWMEPDATLRPLNNLTEKFSQRVWNLWLQNSVRPYGLDLRFEPCHTWLNNSVNHYPTTLRPNNLLRAWIFTLRSMPLALCFRAGPTFLWRTLIRKKLINSWTSLNYFSPEGHKWG